MKKEEVTYTIEVEKDDKIYSCVIKEPDSQTKRKVMTMLFNDPENILGGGMTILTNSFLKGDSEILTDDDLSLSASLQCLQLIKIANATLKKN